MHPDDRTRIAQLNPTLRGILEAELAAGNTIVDTQGGWPASESIVVYLKKDFHVNLQSLPANVRYRQLGDSENRKAQVESCDQPHLLIAIK